MTNGLPRLKHRDKHKRHKPSSTTIERSEDSLRIRILLFFSTFRWRRSKKQSYQYEADDRIETRTKSRDSPALRDKKSSRLRSSTRNPEPRNRRPTRESRNHERRIQYETDDEARHPTANHGLAGEDDHVRDTSPNEVVRNRVVFGKAPAVDSDESDLDETSRASETNFDESESDEDSDSVSPADSDSDELSEVASEDGSPAVPEAVTVPLPTKVSVPPKILPAHPSATLGKLLLDHEIEAARIVHIRPKDENHKVPGESHYFIIMAVDHRRRIVEGVTITSLRKREEDITPQRLSNYLSIAGHKNWYLTPDWRTKKVRKVMRDPDLSLRDQKRLRLESYAEINRPKIFGFDQLELPPGRDLHLDQMSFDHLLTKMAGKCLLRASPPPGR
ncbi:hypothetical protein F5B20DRAFT_578130 [Whalleya microplaca]|nr:hypothetical protein F5B20DRAFT_578130 [Whalleya microplaca]